MAEVTPNEREAVLDYYAEQSWAHLIDGNIEALMLMDRAAQAEGTTPDPDDPADIPPPVQKGRLRTMTFLFAVAAGICIGIALTMLAYKDWDGA